MTYFQAIVIALIQGVTELFPISSLGHSVLVPAWFGGSWQTLVTQSSQESSESSFYLAYIVALHCATALALLWFFRADWIRIIRGFLRSLPASVRLSVQARRLRLSVRDKDERLAWMVIFATIPVGVTGLVLEHDFRTLFAKPLAAAAFLFVNGLILLGAEALRRSAARRKQPGATVTAGRPVQSYAPAGSPPAAVPGYPAASAPAYPDGQAAGEMPASHRKPSGGRAADDIAAAEESDERISRLSYGSAIMIGSAQILALLAGISRSGVTMAGGLLRGLDHEDAARFAFLLATPVILAAGVLKVPSLAGHAGAHIHGQVAVGFIVCGIAAYLSVRFLVRWFQTRTLTPFAIYCLAFGLLSLIRFG
ncbi:MAG TPA: undecaprenyl-diphosphate phosphatase [Trebonia sp.]